MVPTGPDGSGRIFISYRREDTAYAVGWLFDRLTEHLGEGQVFKDVDSIELGQDFVQVIDSAVSSCDVLLAVIGDRWLTITDRDGHRRLDDPGDFVRREIEAALTRDVRVIPILVEGAAMPQADELPGSLSPLARRNALELSPSSFEFDTNRLLAQLDKALVEIKADRSEIAMSPTPKPTPRRSGLHRPALIAALLVTLIVGVVAVALSTRSAESTDGGTATGPDVPPSPSPHLLTTSPSSSNHGPLEGMLLSDDFSRMANRWTVASDAETSGSYSDGAFLVSVKSAGRGTGGAVFPEAVQSVFPLAPADVRIEVDAHRVPGSDPATDYGVLCRAGKASGNTYILTVAGNQASIAKSAGEYSTLKESSPTIDATATNHLRAECTSRKGGAVHLALWVNDVLAVEVVDAEAPLEPGSVALWVGIGRAARKTAQAEFDDVRISTR
jgi:hypothetical protein